MTQITAPAAPIHFETLIVVYDRRGVERCFSSEVGIEVVFPSWEDDAAMVSTLTCASNRRDTRAPSFKRVGDGGDGALLKETAAASNTAAFFGDQMSDSSMALRYLRATDAVPLAIAERDGAACLTTGRVVVDAASTYWVHADQAGDLARQTRLLAGDRPDVSRLIAALRETAQAQRVALTEHADAVRRATLAAADLDHAFDQLKEGRLLRSFNSAYRQHRREAKDSGHGYMPYRTALMRLKRAVAIILANGQDPEHAHINFKAILRSGRRARTPRPKPPPTSSWW
jgi:hypothetical protein